MTHEEYIEAYLKDKLSKWEKKNPKPLENDIFYKEEYPKWTGARYEFAALLSQKMARKETAHCKQNMCKYCFDYKKCNKEFMNVLGYDLDDHGNSIVNKAAQSQDRHWDTILSQTGDSSSAKRRVVQFYGMDKSRDMEVVYPLSLIISESGVRIPLPQQLSLEVRKLLRNSMQITEPMII